MARGLCKIFGLARSRPPIALTISGTAWAAFTPRCTEASRPRPVETAGAVRAAKEEGRRVVAVGTTTVRVLEFAVRRGGVQAGSGWCDLFIYPGYRFQVIDAQLTNFHLPGSSLIMLVSAWAGRTLVLDAYAEAVRERYRFYSYGDAMLIE